MGELGEVVEDFVPGGLGAGPDVRIGAQAGIGVQRAGLEDDHYLQGALQLALGVCADEFLPEVIGFNLGYEQLPLHLLITAYELSELGIDPYYFTLHVTIDNASSGHACKAAQSVLNLLPLSSDTTVTGPFPFLPPFPFLLELLAGVEAKPVTASARL